MMNELRAMRPWWSFRIHRYAFIVCAVLWPAAPWAHDIPNDVKVQLFVKPEAQRLVLLARVPMIAMREVDFPTRGASGYLDLTRVDPALRNAAKLWLIDNVEVYEGDRLLTPATIADARVSLPSDRSFESWSQARANLSGARLPREME